MVSPSHRGPPVMSSPPAPFMGTMGKLTISACFTATSLVVQTSVVGTDGVETALSSPKPLTPVKWVWTGPWPLVATGSKSSGRPW